MMGEVSWDPKERRSRVSLPPPPPSPFPPLSPSPLLPLTPRGIIVYIEYQSVCPFVGIGSPTPSPASECVSPLGLKGGRSNTPLRVNGRGNPISDDCKVCLALCILCALICPNLSNSCFSLLLFFAVLYSSGCWVTSHTIALHSWHCCSSLISRVLLLFTPLSASLSHLKLLRSLLTCTIVLYFWHCCS